MLLYFLNSIVLVLFSFFLSFFCLSFLMWSTLYIYKVRAPMFVSFLKAVATIGTEKVFSNANKNSHYPKPSCTFN